MFTEIKVSKMPRASTLQSNDLLMLVQNGASKNIDMATMFSNVAVPFVFNPNKVGLNLTVHGLLQSNLLVTNGSTNRVGILTDNPESTFQVVGDIQVGGSSRLARVIASITTDAADDADGDATRVVTVVTEEPHGFVTSDKITIAGVTGSDGVLTHINGIKTISVIDNTSFTFLIPEGANVNVSTITNNGAGGSATKITYFPGTYKDSLEEIVISANQATTIVPISASYSISSLNLTTATNFSLSRVGAVGQRKTIFLNSVYASSDKATISGISGLGFNNIQFNSVGDSVTLMFNGSKWVVVSSYKAIISTK